MSSGKPVLLLAYHFPPDNASGSARPFRFYKYLPEYGYEPHVITASPQTGVQLPRVTFAVCPVANPKDVVRMGGTRAKEDIFYLRRGDDLGT